MKKPNKEKFKLEKIKLTNGGGLALKFEIQEVIGGDSYTSQEDIKSSKDPHPDLLQCLHEMRLMVAQVFGFTHIRTIVNSPKFGVDKVQLQAVEAYVEEMAKKINVTGISISGEDDKTGVVITSTFTVDNKQKVALNTPRIMLNASSRGFEEKLSELVQTLTDEAYLFLYESKVSAPEFFEYAEETELKETV